VPENAQDSLMHQRLNQTKKISKPTIAPIAIPPNFFNPFVYTTIRITNIRKADANISIQIIT